jgi:hypothetical protein
MMASMSQSNECRLLCGLLAANMSALVSSCLRRGGSQTKQLLLLPKQLQVKTPAVCELHGSASFLGRRKLPPEYL